MIMFMKTKKREKKFKKIQKIPKNSKRFGKVEKMIENSQIACFDEFFRLKKGEKFVKFLLKMKIKEKFYRNFQPHFS